MIEGIFKLCIAVATIATTAISIPKLYKATVKAKNEGRTWEL